MFVYVLLSESEDEYVLTDLVSVHGTLKSAKDAALKFVTDERSVFNDRVRCWEKVEGEMVWRGIIDRESLYPKPEGQQRSSKGPWTYTVYSGGTREWRIDKSQWMLIVRKAVQ